MKSRKKYELRALLGSVVIFSTLIPLQTPAIAVLTPKFEIYLDQPFVQASYVSGTTNSLTETFNSFSVAAGSTTCANLGLAIGTVSNNTCNMWPNNDDLGAITTNSAPLVNSSGTERGSNFAATGGGGGFRVTFSERQKYVGFWWAAGSAGNAVRFYSNNQKVAEMDVGDLAHAGTLVYRLGGAPDCTNSSTYLAKSDSVQALSGDAYIARNYFGPPWGYTSNTPTSCNASAARGEAYAYIHAFALNGATFDSVEFAGNNFELDNITISKNVIVPLDALVLLDSINASANTYTITYNENGGSGATGGSTSYVVGTAFTLPSAPTKNSSVFAGWYSDLTGGVRAGGGGATADLGTTSNITIYAQWKTKPLATTTETQFDPADLTVAGEMTEGTDLTVGARATDELGVYITDSWGSFSYSYEDGKGVVTQISNCQTVAIVSTIARCEFRVPHGTSPYIVHATFNSSDLSEYQNSTNQTLATVVILINHNGSGGGGYSNPLIQAPQLPGITWNPLPIKEGEPLSENQLNVHFSVPGKVTYSIPLGTKLQPGKVQIKITFTPDDTNKYMIMETTQTLEVLPLGQQTVDSQNIPTTDPKTINTKNLTSLGKIYFNNNEFFLDASDRKELKNIALIAKAENYKSVLIFGNTDIKKGVNNIWLSKERATAVVSYLKQYKLRVQWTKAWFGPTRPASKGLDKASLALNRRVEIYLLK